MKRIVGVELSHQKAPLAVRENISLNKDEVKEALQRLKPLVDEVFIISTCNRLSVYALTDDIQPLLDFFRSFGPLDPYLSIFDHDVSAIRHLFSTASGLESQAIGEHEILGQIRNAYTFSQEAGGMGPIFNEFVRKGIHAGKRVRKETAIGKYPVSLASVSYDIIKDIHKDLTKTTVLVLGTGEMATLMLKLIEKKGVKKIYIASRTSERAKLLAHTTGGEAILLEDIHTILPEANVIIGATHSESHILGHDEISVLVGTYQKTFIDLGLPRNFDPVIKTLLGIKVFDLDDIKSLTYKGMQKRQEEVPKAINIIDDETDEFVAWLNTREISPLISSYYTKLGQIQEEELKWALPKLGKLDGNQQKILENLISRVARRVSGKPIEKLRNFAQQPHLEQNPLDTFKELFDL
jgi:glutamyl-tRNA reductase